MAHIETLPLFPLELVLYPGERLPLHIFEPRYKELTRYCLEADMPFGIVYYNDDEIASMGSTARIQEVLQEYEDGRFDILVVGERRFRIHDVDEDTEAYLTADVETLEEPDTPADPHLKERVITQHMKLLEMAGHQVRPSMYEHVDLLSYALAQNAGLETRQKQELLEIKTEQERIRYLVRHFEELLPRVEEQENLRRKIQSNGHLKDFPIDE